MVTNRIIPLVLFICMSLEKVLQETSAQEQGFASRNGQSAESSLFFFHQSEYPRDCQEVHDQCSSSASDGVYVIKPDGLPDPFEVFCDVNTDSGGWTVIQRRHFHGTIGFSRDWGSYKSGFGFLSHDFWIGNERLSHLTNQKPYQLLIEVTTSDGLSFNQSYSNFSIGDGYSNYKLVSASYQPELVEHISWCPDNMIYGNCTCGQRQCTDPTLCHDTCDNNLTEGCLCPDGYYMQGEDCVLKQECDCYISHGQKLLLENETYVDDLCTTFAICSNGQLVRNDSYECSPNAVCAERDGVRQCYCNQGYIGDGVTCNIEPVLYTDCQDVYNAGNTADDVYTIRPTNWQGDPFNVYCNMTSSGHGCTVFQRRIDGSVDFDLNWINYTRGFGSVDHEHWLGNNKLFHLTNQRNYEIRIDMVFKNGNPYYAVYDAFRINDQDDKFRLSSLGSFSGNAPGGSTYFPYNRNYQFTTRDQDNDVWSSNCATDDYSGGWWYKHCSYTALNGIYSTSDCSYYSIVWNYNYCSYYNLKYVEMKMRPI